MRLPSQIALLVTAIPVLSLLSEEKYSIAKNSDLVVIGQMQQVSARRKAGNIYFTGTIVAQEVLFGRAISGQKLSYEFVCSCCRPEIAASDLPTVPEIWFLRTSSNGKWTTAGPSSCSDPGFRRIEESEDMRRYFRGK